MRILSQSSQGICIETANQKILIDSSAANGHTNIISHAHSDHAFVRKNSNCIMTEQTADLLEGKIPAGAKIRHTKHGEKFQLGDATVSLHDAGHILGSSQVCIEADKTFVATSDFKLQDSLLFKAADILKSDILCIEATFGSDYFRFPSREWVYAEMQAWLNHCLEHDRFVILGGYSTGKAQELTKFVNEFSNETPIVHEKIFKQNKVYEKHGIKLGNYIKLENNLHDSNILILPPSLMSDHLNHALSIITKKKVVSAIATGWQFPLGHSRIFPLSDHADYQQLMQYIKQSEPKTVYVHTGFAKEFAHSVTKELGIPAYELAEQDQKKIAEYSL